MRRASWMIAAMVAGVAALPVAAQEDFEFPASWTQAIEPFRIAGDLYYVGTAELTAFLLAGDDGHVLIDAPMQENVELLLANIRALGFDPADARVQLASHGHFDHTGGIASLLEATGAELVLSDAAAALVGSGGRSSFFDFGEQGAYRPATADRTIDHLQTLAVGSTRLTAHLTPGHTRGCTSWSGTVNVDGEDLSFVSVCSLSVLPGYRLVGDDPSYPGIARDFCASERHLRSLRPDIFLASHASFIRLQDKLAALQAGEPRAFVDPDGYTRYLDRALRQIEATLEEQGHSGGCAALLAEPASEEASDWDAVGDEAVDVLRRYLRIDTSNPPGRVIESAAFLREILEAEGIETHWFESDPGVAGNLLARLPASGTPVGKPLLLLHHMDVVPADRERWPRDPFGGDLVDGQIWGRGAMDMKGLGVIHLMTLLQLARQEVPLDRDVLLLAVADEETGGARGLNWMVEHHPDVVDVDWVFDEGGFGARDVLADGRLVFNVSVAEKQIVWLELRAEGIAGHGSQPHDANPNDRLVRALDRILDLPDMGEAPEVVAEMRRRIGAPAANKFTDAITHSTLSLTSLTSGVGDPPKVNVIPSLARATVDARLLPGVPVEDFLERLRRAAGDGVSVETTYVMDEAPVTAWDTDLFGVIEETLRRHHPDAVVTPSPIPYGTDANTLRARGAGAYGFTPVVLSLEIVSSMHGDAERVPVEGFRRGVRIFYEIVESFVGAGAGR